jgi:hypothetical protein
MEERGEVECFIHPSISQWSQGNRTEQHRSSASSSRSEFHREIQQRETLVIYVSLYTSGKENKDIWEC